MTAGAPGVCTAATDEAKRSPLASDSAGPSSVTHEAPRADRRTRAPGRNRLIDVYLALRLSVAGFSALLPLIGASSAAATLSVGTTGGLLAIAMAFHVFAYLVNDVVDLDIDRREPQRAAYPLVRGAFPPRRALTLALAQPLIAFAAAARLGADAAALATLTGGFIAMAAYDVWGKRCGFPPLTDLVQAVAWACLLLFGAQVAASPTAQTAWLAVAVVAYVLLVNGVHGALRDLVNDAACGARTTALYLGARASSTGLTVPPVLMSYALVLHGLMLTAVLAALFATAGGPLAAAEGGPLVAVRGGSLVVLAGGFAAAVALLLVAQCSRDTPARAKAAATWHLFTCMALLAVPLLPRIDRESAVLLAAVFFLPILAMYVYRKTEP